MSPTRPKKKPVLPVAFWVCWVWRVDNALFWLADELWLRLDVWETKRLFRTSLTWVGSAFSRS